MNSAAWISVRTLKPLCVGNIRARAKLRGEMTISNCPGLLFMSELSTHITKPPLFTGTNQKLNLNQKLNPAVCPLRATSPRMLLLTSNQTNIHPLRGELSVNVTVSMLKEERVHVALEVHYSLVCSSKQ